MGQHWVVILRKLGRNLSLRAGLFSLIAFVGAMSAVMLAPYVPDGLAKVLGGDAVDHILSIMATSMLAVVTFSLSTLISTYAIVAAGAPPRATALVVEDSRAHTALATFLGAFIFSIVSLVALSTGYYGPKGRVILFAFTVIVLISVVWTIIRWIGQLSGLGRLDHVIAKVEAAAAKSISGQSTCFALFGQKMKTAGGPHCPIFATKTGFVQRIELQGLSDYAEEQGLNLTIIARPGDFVHPNFEICTVQATECSEPVAEKIRSSFLVGDRRTFDDDPRFGFIVLSEIGSRALSPGINDPGTAIQVLSSLSRLALTALETSRFPKDQKKFARLKINPVRAEEIFDDAFRAIGRDGASQAEVVIFLQKVLASFKKIPEFEGPAYAQAEESLARAMDNLTNPHDLARVKAAAGRG